MTAYPVPEPSPEQTYPGVELAYDLALKSYDVAQQRYEAVDARIQTILAFGTTLTVAVPAIFTGLSFSSPWFYLSLVLYACAAVLGMYARLQGTLEVINPTHLYREWLDLTPWEFKKNTVYFAGKHFNLNTEAIKYKHQLAVRCSFLFLIEGAALAVWVAGG